MDFVPMRDNYFFAGVPKSPTVQSCVHINFVSDNNCKYGT